jgi:DNA-directed RNA polymerase sigma subunit (sigma70/sigma32)
VPHEQAEAKGLRLYLEEVRRVSPPDPAEEEQLFRRIRRGDLRAVDEVAVRNLGLVADVVTGQGADGVAADRLDQGNRALVEAIAAFAAGGCGTFRDYARSRICRAVQAAPRRRGRRTVH